MFMRLDSASPESRNSPYSCYPGFADRQWRECRKIVCSGGRRGTRPPGRSEGMLAVTLRCKAQPQLASLPPRVETIDTRSPEVAPLWAELRERGSALGLDGAYFLIVPSFEPGGARVAAAASARIRPLLETYRAGRNPEINVAILSGFAGSEPDVWRPDVLLAELPLPFAVPGRPGWSGWPKPGAFASTTASTSRCSRRAGGGDFSRSTRPRARSPRRSCERSMRPRSASIAPMCGPGRSSRRRLTELEAGALRWSPRGSAARRPSTLSGYPRRRRRRRSSGRG